LEEIFMKKTWGAFAVLGLLLTIGAGAQTPVLPPEVLTGVLPDGITYFIERNARPQHRVQLSLLVHAGSIQETEAQRGIAHLLEHMEFQGTEHFGPQAIVNFLETNGMKFGADLNASTGFTSTQYYLVLPTDKPEAFQTGLQILDDWSRGPQITPSVLENEKKVVMEEGRLRMENVRGRITDFVVPLLYEGTPYAHRLPIGSMDVVKNAVPETVLGFSRAWYRPENMAVTIVGDLDPETVRTQLLKQFVTRGSPPGPAVPANPPVPEAQGRQVHSFQDKEMAYPQIEWTTTGAFPRDTYEGYRHFELLDALMTRILNTRMSQLSRSAQPPFQDAAVYGRVAFGASWERTFTVEPYDGKADEAVEAFTKELERVRANGFTATDFRLAVSELRSEIETAYAQRNGITNEDRSSALAEFYLERLPLAGDDSAHTVGLNELSSIGLEELNQFARQAMAFPDFRMVVLSPAKPGVVPPSSQEILAAISRVQASSVAPSPERIVLPLLETLPPPGKILEVKALPDLGVTVYSLSNGARVMTKKTDFTPHEVLVQAQRLGGTSLVDDPDVLSVDQAASVFSQTGLGRLSQNQLSDFLSGKQAQLEVGLENSTVSVGGSSTTTDLETLFQMLHEQFAPPHRDADAEAAWRNQTRNYLANSQNLPATLAENEKNRLLTNGSPRALPLTTDRLDSVDLDRAAKVYGDLLSDPSGLVLSVVGDFDEEQVRHLIETYIASLAPGPETAVKDRGIRPIAGPVRSVIAAGADNKAENTLFMIVPRPFRPDDRFAANTLREILDIRLREVLRNQNGGTYDVGSEVALTPFPYPQALVAVQFTCEPERQVELADKALAVLTAVGAGTFDEPTLMKAKEILARGVESYLTQNNFWVSVLPDYTLKGYDLTELARLKELYQAVTREQVAALAKEVLTTKTALQVILEPKK
jgi:zinc protease